MQYAQLINNQIHYAPNPLIVGDRVIGNPSDEVYIEQGYLPVIETDPPEVDEQHYAVPGWEERDGQIVQVWTVEELPEDGEATAEDYEAALAELGVTVDD